MSSRDRFSLTLAVASFGCAVLLVVPAAAAQEKVVPKVWDEKQLHEMELPLVGIDRPVKHAPPTFYDAVDVLPIARGYPVYHPDKEPKDYMAMLRQKDPETVALDPTQFQTDADWIKAGGFVFHAPDTGGGPSVEDAHNPSWYKDLDVPVAGDGTLPGFRYVIRKKGEVKIEGANCARCHTRVLRDGPLKGTVVTGHRATSPTGGDSVRTFAHRPRQRVKQPRWSWRGSPSRDRTCPGTRSRGDDTIG